MLGVECSTPTAGPPWPSLETPHREARRPKVPTHAPRARAQRQRLERHVTRTPRLPCTRRGPASYCPRPRSSACETTAYARGSRGHPAGLETPARTYCGGDLVARLLNDFNGGQRPRPRGQAPERLQRRPTTKTPWCPCAHRGVRAKRQRLVHYVQDHVVPVRAPRGPRQASTTSALCPRPRGAHARTAGSAPNVND